MPAFIDPRNLVPSQFKDFLSNGISHPTLPPPSSTVPTSNPPKFLIIGGGSRGNAYARAVTTSTSGVIASVAEPGAFKRRELGQKYIWGANGYSVEGQEFSGWQEWLEWEQQRRRRAGSHNDQELGPPEGVDGVFICTLDETHATIIRALAPLNLHILCEKPLALSVYDCLSIYKSIHPPDASSPPSKIFSIGHVLRYSPHNVLLRKLLLEDEVIGDIVSLEHTEPIGYWHFSHSYVRGNWRRHTLEGIGSLLTKSCHDIDFIMWLLCSPASKPFPDQHSPHLPHKITSTGSLTHFRRSRKPPLAGEATNCLSCKAEKECIYSSQKIYNTRHLQKHDTGWPLKIVAPEIEDVLKRDGMAVAEATLMRALAENYDKNSTSDAEIAARPWFGRCVYESDNDVCDDQVVTISWEDDPLPVDSGLDMATRLKGRGAKTALFHMIAPSEKQCVRRGRVYGTKGEIEYDSRNIRIYDFSTDKSTTHHVPKQPPEEEKAHGGGDYGLARAFVNAVVAAEKGDMSTEDAQVKYVGCTLEEIVRSHALVFAAEEARREGRVVEWREWWRGNVGVLGGFAEWK